MHDEERPAAHHAWFSNRRTALGQKQVTPQFLSADPGTKFMLGEAELVLWV